MAIADSITKGAYHIANNRVELNPQRRNNFTLVITDIDGILRVGADMQDPQDEDRIANAQNEIIISLKSCTIPKYSVSKQPISRGNSVIKFAGKPTFDDVTLEAYDYMGSDVKDTFMAWLNLCYNTTFDFVGSVSNTDRVASYKKSCTLIEETPDGTPVHIWEIRGAFPLSVSSSDKDAEADDVSTVSVTLSIDWAEMKKPD